MKNTAAQARQLLEKTYGKHASSDLQVLLDEDPCENQKQLANILNISQSDNILNNVHINKGLKQKKTETLLCSCSCSESLYFRNNEVPIGGL